MSDVIAVVIKNDCETTGNDDVTLETIGEEQMCFAEPVGRISFIRIFTVS